MRKKKELLRPAPATTNSADGKGPFNDPPKIIELLFTVGLGCIVTVLMGPEDRLEIGLLVVMTAIALFCLVALKRKWPSLLGLTVLAVSAVYLFCPRCDCELCERKDLKLGDTVFFGGYFQNGTEEKEALPWTILEVKEDSLVMITRDCIDARQFHPFDAPDCSWQTSELRTFLNFEFLDTAFSEKEKKHILPVIAPEQDKAYVVSQEDNRSDKVFLLSLREFSQYFPHKNDAVAYPTTYARIKGAGFDREAPGEPGWYWLRTRGAEPFRTMNSKSDGSINETGNRVSNTSLSLRPVIVVAYE